MRIGSLSLQQLPELRTPMGFFRTAPWFGILAGVFVLVSGPSIWLSRWMPGMLAATHLLLLGCLVMVMMGAMVQVLPVISSARVRGIEKTAVWIRGCLGGGTIALAAALNYESRILFGVAGTLLSIAFSMFLLPLALTLSRRVGGGDAMFAIRLATLSLAVTVGLGLYLAIVHISPELDPGFRELTHTHLGFGLIGWMTVLIMAVSFQVLPMFYVAPDYPRWVSRGAPVTIVVALALQLTWLTAIACCGYGLLTLVVLGRRKRRAPDVTIRFWQIAAVVLMLLAITVATIDLAALDLGPSLQLTLGVLFVNGFVLTAMTGMVYKIVPFLVFTHLQRQCLQGAVDVAQRVAMIPTMHDILPTTRARTQLWLHLLNLALATTATLWPAVGPLVGIGMVVGFAWLAASIHMGWRCYRTTHALVRSKSTAVDAARGN